MAALSAWFWNERFWLPHNVTWADLADPAPGVEYPKASHLLSALPLALGIFAVRILFERYVLSVFLNSYHYIHQLFLEHNTRPAMPESLQPQIRLEYLRIERKCTWN